ncbi:MAG: CDP-alcohol phosphatidyltransferase family protein [Sphingobacteriales bacterium]|nr:MAG: CDP-alcohol phosphatidyltransferase family protein [Sphingobacteriales bacterium]
MKKLPLLLVLLRPLLGLLLLLLRDHPYFYGVAITLVSAGLLSDIFDGIIARRLGVATPLLRRLDSAADNVFWLTLALTAYLRFPPFFSTHALSIAVLLGTETACYVISFVRFGKEVATHAIASKLWTLVLFATLLQLLLSGTAPVLYPLCFGAGLATRLEIIGIILLLPRWTTDVPGLRSALRLRRGKPVHHYKLFNG